MLQRTKMTLLYQTARLEGIAFEALDGIVASIEPSLSAIQRLQVLIHAAPPAFANAVTRRLTKAIDKTEFVTRFDGILGDLVKAVIHTRVSIFHCDFQCYQLSHHVFIMLGTLCQLRELNIKHFNNVDEELIVKGLKTLCNLETLVLACICTDAILMTACSSCTQLHSVDVSGSHLVTDVCIPYLMRLHNLKHLDVFGTTITPDRLFRSLPETLESLGCNYVADLVILAWKYPLLMSLQADVDECSVPVQRFVSLKLHFTEFCKIKPHLSENLVELQLHGCKNVDVGIIVKHCCGMVRFAMHSCSYDLEVLHLESISPRLVKLEHFTLDKSSKFHLRRQIDTLVVESVIGAARGLRELHVESYAHFNLSFFHSLISRNELKDLKEISMFAIYSEMLAPDAVEYLLLRCPKLEVVHIRGIQVLGMQVFLDRVKSEFPTVKFTMEVMDPSP